MKATACVGVFTLALLASADEGWNEREARAVREQVYLSVEHLSDFAQIKATFEKGLSNDASAATALAALVSHTNQDVASTAAQMLGRFPSPAASLALQHSYSTDARILVRAAALAGLARMKDPATAPLAVAALEGDDEAMQGAGLGALEALGDSSRGAAILQYYDRHPDEIGSDRLVALGKLGDPPGSTLVRDRLVAEANKKTNPFRLRYSAALGLKAMGLAGLVQPILDISNARNTHRRLAALKDEIQELGARRGVTVKSQAEVDILLRDVQIDDPRDKQDLWKRPLRAKFVSQGLFDVVSDGPDMTPNTADDMSTSEKLNAYLDRVFPDQFVQP